MAEMKFEEALKKLEEIVGDLEDGNLSLDDALDKYEEGIKLSKLCAKRLEAAKKKVEILLKSEDGTVELKPFDPSTALRVNGEHGRTIDETVAEEKAEPKKKSQK